MRRPARIVRPGPSARRARDDGGWSLIEIAVTIAVMGVLLTITVPIVNTVFRASTNVTDTYLNTNQLLPVDVTLQQLMRSAVQPAPFEDFVPTPPFGQWSYAAGTETYEGDLTSWSLQFYSNVYNASLGQNEPAQITACIEQTNGQLGCAANTPTATETDFEVSETLPYPGSCPSIGTPTDRCAWNTTTGCSPCGIVKFASVITGVDNYQISSTTDPIFSYLAFNTTTVTSVSTGVASTTDCWLGSSPCNEGANQGAPLFNTATSTDPTNPPPGWWSCTAYNPPNGTVSTISSPLGFCPAAEINEVTVSLNVNGYRSSSARPGWGPSQGAAQTSVYLRSPVSSAFSWQVG